MLADTAAKLRDFDVFGMNRVRVERGAIGKRGDDLKAFALGVDAAERELVVDASILLQIAREPGVQCGPLRHRRVPRKSS